MMPRRWLYGDACTRACSFVLATIYFFCLPFLSLSSQIRQLFPFPSQSAPTLSVSFDCQISAIFWHPSKPGVCSCLLTWKQVWSAWPDRVFGQNFVTALLWGSSVRKCWIRLLSPGGFVSSLSRHAFVSTIVLRAHRCTTHMPWLHRVWPPAESLGIGRVAEDGAPCSEVGCLWWKNYSLLLSKSVCYIK